MIALASGVFFCFLNQYTTFFWPRSMKLCSRQKEILQQSKLERNLVVKEGRCTRKPTGRGNTTGLPDKVCLIRIDNNYSMSPSWIWSDKITKERVARVGYNHFISNKGEWNNCFSKFSNRVLPPIFISTILQSEKFLNLAHYFPYDVKLRLLAHSRSFLANQKARNAIVGAENLLKTTS